MRVPLHSMAGETVGELELRDDVFGLQPNISLMHQAVLRQQANARLGTHKVKNRAEVAGGGRKPYKQKGTGRARQGSIRAPQFRGGGVVFGPQVRSYNQKMNRKMRRLALMSALSVKVGEEQMTFVQDLTLDTHKTRAMSELLDKLGIDSKVLMILPASDENIERSAANLPDVKTVLANNLSVRDLLMYDRVVMAEGSVDVIYRTYAADRMAVAEEN
ncbi:MAG: 50S ribosomal protein L4 [Chloroflexi bacterium]|nr:50S ribosomal protein L4 [Chloroflexota bacterium]